MPVGRVLYLVHRIGLAAQVGQTFGRLLDMPVTILGAGAGNRREVPSDGILVATVQTLSNLLGLARVNSFLKSCDIVFVDELHVNKAWQATRILERCQAPMRFGLSGTIREDNKVKMMHYVGMTGPIIAQVSNQELVRLGRSAKPYIRFVEVHCDRVIGKYDWSYKYGIVQCKERNRLVIEETLRHVNKDRKTLVTVSRRAHGFRLQRMFERRVDVPVEFIHGTTPLDIRKKVIRRFEKGEVPILIASPIFDTGVDIPAIQACVFCGGGIGWELILQRLGRLLRRKKGRNKVYVTDFVDLQNDYLLKHSLSRLKYYQKENIANVRIVENV